MLIVVIVSVATAAPAAEDLREMESTVLVCFHINLSSEVLRCLHTQILMSAMKKWTIVTSILNAVIPLDRTSVLAIWDILVLGSCLTVVSLLQNFRLYCHL